jgi:hypothetical protein
VTVMNDVLIGELVQSAKAGRKLDMAALVRQLAPDDPRVAQMLDALASGQADPAPRAPEPDVEPPREIARLTREAARLARLNERLAQALGACVCWGEDPACPDCAGEGSPGCYFVDRRLFAYFVRPALEQLRQNKTTTTTRSGDVKEENP